MAIGTLSLHDALPISGTITAGEVRGSLLTGVVLTDVRSEPRDRKSTRLNSSHDQTSYADFCLKKKRQPVAVAGGHGRRGRPRIHYPHPPLAFPAPVTA